MSVQIKRLVVEITHRRHRHLRHPRYRLHHHHLLAIGSIVKLDNLIIICKGWITIFVVYDGFVSNWVNVIIDSCGLVLCGLLWILGIRVGRISLHLVICRDVIDVVRNGFVNSSNYGLVSGNWRRWDLLWGLLGGLWDWLWFIIIVVVVV